MDLGGGRRLTGTDLSFTVPDTKPVPRMPAEGAGHISGGADALADLLMRDALKRYVGVTLDPNAIKGQFDGDLKLDLTLGKGVQPEDQKFRVTGNLNALAIDKFLGNAKLEQGALAVEADRTQLKMTGTGLVLGAQAKLEVSKVGQDVGALTLTGNLDEAARAKLGFNAGPRLTRPGRAEAEGAARQERRGGRGRSRQGDAGFAQAARRGSRPGGRARRRSSSSRRLMACRSTISSSTPARSPGEARLCSAPRARSNP